MWVGIDMMHRTGSVTMAWHSKAWHGMEELVEQARSKNSEYAHTQSCTHAHTHAPHLVISQSRSIATQ